MSDSKMVSVPRELLERLAAPTFTSGSRRTSLQELRALLAARAEDVRAVDEPIGYAAWSTGTNPGTRLMRYDGMVLINPKRGGIYQIPIYRHPQRQTQCSEVNLQCSEHLRTQGQAGQSCPPQSAWPTWANWCGLNTDGYWYYYADEPVLMQSGRVATGCAKKSDLCEPSNAWASMIYQRVQS
jgi:hypothetical protein